MKGPQPPKTRKVVVKPHHHTLARPDRYGGDLVFSGHQSRCPICELVHMQAVLVDKGCQLYMREHTFSIWQGPHRLVVGPTYEQDRLIREAWEALRARKK